MTERPDKEKSRREKRRERWQTFKRTLPDAIELARPHARLWILGLVLLLIARTAGLVLPGMPKFLMDDVLPNQDYQKLYLLIGAVLGATTLQGFANFALTQTISKAGQRLIADLRIKIHRHVSRLGLRYFDNQKTGEIVSRVMNDVEGVRNLVGTGMVEFLGGIITAVFASVILFVLNWQLSLAILAFFGIFFVVLIKAFSILGPIFKKRQEVTADVSGRLTESIGGIRVVKAYNTEDVERKTFAEGVYTLLHHLFRTINAISVVALTSSVLLGVLGAAVLYIGGQQLMTGEMTQGEFISYLLYLGFLIAPLSSVLMIGTQLSEAFAGIERMKEVLDQKPEDEDETEKQPVPPIEGRVQFENVEFAYEEGKPVLQDVSFTAESNSVTALVGPSGSGKSTLIGLVASFYQPQKGRVLVDDIDLIQARLHDYRSQLGVVLQENFLFGGTIRENLRYARAGATDEQLHAAARIAHCTEFIDRFPDGLDTVIGERGIKLSGGQRQRLAIARALLANPKILILDEATSALDSESEAYIQEGLSHLMEGRTTFVIAHRLSTIRHATQILVLDEGRVIEHGTHEELLGRRGKYFEMYTRQHHAGDDVFLAPGETENGEGQEETEETKDQRRERFARFSRLISGE